MYKYKEKLKEKYENKCNIAITGYLLICYLISLILIIIWLFKLNKNAKSEPSLRNLYIIEDPSTYYREDEFCYENYEPFLVKGALDIFDIPTSRIRKFCKALLSTIFISLGLIIISTILFLVSKAKHSEGTEICGFCLYALAMISIILSIIFAIILIHNYSKGNYRDFAEFYRCRYLSQKFRKDYAFVFDVETGYQMPIAIIVITEFFNFIKLIAENSPDV